MQERITGLVGDRFERLHLDRGGERRRAFIAVIPDYFIPEFGQQYVGRLDHWRGRTVQGPGRIQFFTGKRVRLVPPNVGRGLDLDR